MKTISRMMMTIVLLVMALTANAQYKTEGTINSLSWREGMTYSFSGGRVIEKETPEKDCIEYTYEVEEETELSFSCSRTKSPKKGGSVPKVEIFDDKGKRIKKATGVETASMTYKVPKWKKEFTVTLGISLMSNTVAEVVIKCIVIPKKKTAPYNVNVCPHCHHKDSKIRFNDLYGEVSIRCNFEDDDAYEYAELDTEIFEDDRIRTKEESGAILGLEDMSTYVIKPESTLIIHTEEGNTSKLEMLVGSMIVNIKKIIEGKSLEVEMNQCVTSINGTIVAFEQKGKESNVWLMAGAVSVKSKKTGKVTKLQPGQRSITGKNGVVQVKSFNIEEGAKKFGIKMSDINNHYSNKTTNTKTTSTIKTAPGKYARYGVKCGIVKRVETTAKERTYTTTWFDDYGRLERIENTKKETKSGNNWVSAANYKFVTIIKDDKQYRLDPNRKRGTSYSLSTITNFIDPNLKLVKGYGVQKTNGKATVDNRQCDVFKGKEAKLAGDATVEHYVWQGIPLKSVEKAPDGTTTTTLQSIELPNSIDASKFEIPKGYTVK